MSGSGTSEPKRSSQTGISRDRYTNACDVEEWIERVAQLRPKHVTVTTAAEPPLDPDVHRADVSTLERIAAQLRRRTGLAATALP
jgi:hypothetical protein